MFQVGLSALSNTGFRQVRVQLQRNFNMAMQRWCSVESPESRQKKKYIIIRIQIGWTGRLMYLRHVLHCSLRLSSSLLFSLWLMHYLLFLSFIFLFLLYLVFKIPGTSISSSKINKINQVYYLCMLLQFFFVDFHIHFFEMS